MEKIVQHSGTAGVRLAIAFAVLTGIAYRGSKVAVALLALQLGANPFLVGLLAAGYSLFPLMLAMHAGRVTDRVGVRLSLMLGACGLALALLVPVAFPTLAGLFAAVTLLGIAHIYYHVAVHYAVGSLGGKDARARDFANLGLGTSLSAFAGPVAAGFAIDLAGYPATFLMLAGLAAVPAIALLVAPRLLREHVPQEHDQQVPAALDLLRDPRLRRVLLMSGVVVTGLELFAFYMPIYGHSIGASASQIGLVLASYAAAAFLVRMLMPRLSRRLGPERLLAAAVLLGALAYGMFPLFTQVPVLAAIAFVLGLGLGLGQPLTIMLTYDHAPPRRSGEALGMRLTVNKVTQVAIPLLFGSLGTAFGSLPVFLANAVFLASCGALSLRSAARRQSTRPGDSSVTDVSLDRESM